VAHVDPKTLNDTLNGRRQPMFRTLQAICAALDLAIEDLIAFHADPGPLVEHDRHADPR